MKLKKKIKVAIDSPAGAGAGTQAKLIAKNYNLFYLDTGKIYRLVAYFKITNPKQFNYANIKKKIKKLKINDLQNKKLLTNEVGIIASIISKDKFFPYEKNILFFPGALIKPATGFFFIIKPALMVNSSKSLI